MRLKSFYLTSLLLFVCGTTQASNDTYRPFVEEGKVWNVYNYSPTGKLTGISHLYFDGDTVIAGQHCTKMMWSRLVEDGTIQDAHYHAGIFEVGKQVWFFNWQSEEPHLLYDFGVQAGEQVIVGVKRDNPYLEENVSEGYTKEVLFITNGDEQLRCPFVFFWKSISPVMSDNEGYWIEGFGTVRGPMANCQFVTHGYSSEDTRTICLINGEKWLDSSQLVTTAIRNLSESPDNGISPRSKVNVQCSKFYDLSGRRLSTPPAKGMYIQDKRVKIRE